MPCYLTGSRLAVNAIFLSIFHIFRVIFIAVIFSLVCVSKQCSLTHYNGVRTLFEPQSLHFVWRCINPWSSLVEGDEDCIGPIG